MRTRLGESPLGYSVCYDVSFMWSYNTILYCTEYMRSFCTDVICYAPPSNSPHLSTSDFLTTDYINLSLFPSVLLSVLVGHQLEPSLCVAVTSICYATRSESGLIESRDSFAGPSPGWAKKRISDTSYYCNKPSSRIYTKEA